MIPQMEVTYISPEKVTYGCKRGRFEEPGLFNIAGLFVQKVGE